MCSSLRRILIAERTDLNLCKNWKTSAPSHKLDAISRSNTSQPIDRPLLELLQGDFRCGRDVIEVQAVGILLLLI